MHWGIRRYQPYTSNPRKDGKSGKFIGQKSRVVKDEKGMDPVTAIALAAGGIAALKVGKAVAKYQWQKHIAKKGAEKALKEQEKKQEQRQQEKTNEENKPLPGDIEFPKPDKNDEWEFQHTKVKINNRDIGVGKSNQDVDDHDASEAVKSIKKDFKQIESNCKEMIAKEYYDEFDYYHETHTREQFKKELEINYIYVNDKDTATLSVWAKGKGDPIDGHQVDMYYNIPKKKLEVGPMNG